MRLVLNSEVGKSVIPVEEIKEIARRIGVPESTVERDYAQGWLLAHLTSHFDMVLKGETGIRKVYLGDYRFSDDLDFTLLDEYGVDDVEARERELIEEMEGRPLNVEIRFLEDHEPNRPERRP